ncbi:MULTISPECIES: ethanolamine ammonia-lyase reactivating factor EutA [unclassified Paenibacillus]|uniref:ethanolamine ammonia-lyase reactivating factor EutA n=1 Tax=unclassified Paenibacillus TaxID=185978 RepID=UPI002378A16B|nr:ethanolamine ammonia-lyase reactivating factor EutA [Paenibacillus sp. MAHUQ-63]
MAEQWMTSVGLDIGTSTTKLVISRLRIVRASGALSLPRFDIAERELLYASPVYSTPLISGDEVDAERIWGIVTAAYEEAGIRPDAVKSGAVIITGETANLKNAEHILHQLAERAGDFVVATAGSDLEGLLAGKGAGAERRSMQLRGAACNIDIGGGTANAAVFRRGKLAGTVTFRVGGRLVRIDAEGTVREVSPSLRPWLAASGIRLQPGDRPGLPRLKELARSMCRCMMDHLSGRSQPEAPLRALLLGEPLLSVPSIEEWTVSGGIGELLAAMPPESMAEAARHGDIGLLLAQAWKELAAGYAIRHAAAEQTVRATVIGAGMQSTEISGATVHADAALLPVRNLPVLKLELDARLLEPDGGLALALERLLVTGASLYAGERSLPFALAMSGTGHLTYASLQRAAELLHASYSRHFPESDAIVVICETDIAQAFGQSLARRCGQRPKVICIDQVRVEHGDYIDLGEPLSGIMIPVVVKTLAFQRGGEGGRP